MKHILAAATTAALLSLPSAASAAVVFSENFDQELVTTGGASEFNYVDFSQFSVSDGTVDLIRSGDFGINCVTAACVDLDGSSSDAGLLLSGALNFMAGVEYTFVAVMSGNQRGGAADQVTYGVDGVFIDTVSISPSEGFSDYAFSFVPLIDGVGSIGFSNAGGDNVGAILDSVTITSSVAAVPLPATGLLLLGGLGAMAARRRRT